MAKNSQNSFLGVAWACQISGPWSPGKEKKRRPWPGLSQFEFGLSFSHTPTAPGHIPATALSALTAPEYVLIRILWSIGFDYHAIPAATLISAATLRPFFASLQFVSRNFVVTSSAWPMARTHSS